MKKRSLALLMSAAAALCLTACGGEQTPATTTSDPAEPLDLTGTWSVADDDGATVMTATIADDTITVSFDVDGEAWLYWSGSYDAPEEPGDTYTWTSQADGAADSALFGSSDDAKEFSYKNGTLSFELTMQGETGTVEMQRSEEQISSEASANDAASDAYGIGDTWTVDGQWEITINSVTITDERNEFSDKDPAAVYMIDYTYTNLGYEDSIMDGLYIDLTMDASIVDNGGLMGYSYPGNITNYPQETPVGATCNAQEFVGVDNAGEFKLTINKYDGNSKKQTATFQLAAE